MAELEDWNVAAASNNSASPDGWPEGMAPSGVNDTGRENMATVARWYQDTNFSVTSAGAANAYTMVALRVISAYAQGQVFAFEASFANTGAATLNVDSVGAKDIRKFYDQALLAGDIVAGQFVVCAYQAGEDYFQLVSPTAVNTGFLRGKGADIASATTLVIGTDGSYFDVTGTTTITAMTVAAGRQFILQFDGALTLTDGASLDLGGANITTAAGDRAIIFATAANTVQLLAYLTEGSPALTQGLAAAIQAEQETGTATDKAVTPGRQQFHQSAAKAWVQFQGSGTLTVNASYNVTSVTDNGAGDYTVNFTTAFSSANYGFALGAGDGVTPAIKWAGGPNNADPTASAFRFSTYDSAPALSDPDFVGASFFGDQ